MVCKHIAKGVAIPAIGLTVVAATNAVTVRSWDFNNTLLENLGGTAAEYYYGAGSTISPATLPGYVNTTIGGQSATVARFDLDGAIKATYNLNANNTVDGNPATKLNRYTIAADVKFDGADWISFFQKNVANDSDGSLFFAKENDGSYSYGIGSVGYFGSFDATAWHRVGLAVNCEPTYNADDGTWRYANFDLYIDGVKINAGAKTPWAANDSYWSLNSNTTGNAFLYMFADNNSETSGGWINSLAMMDECATAEQMAYLGGADAAGISTKLGIKPVPEPATMVALGLGVVGLLARRRRKN